MRFRTFAVLLLGVALVVTAACNGGDDDPTPAPTSGPVGTPTTAPTATPFASVPDPIIVTGEGAPSGGTVTEGAVTYTVEAGDTLGGIAERFGVEVEVIQEANDLDGVDIFIGQELTIPRQGSTGGTATPTATATPSIPSGVDTYTVEAGDTAFGIALEFDTTVEALEEANGVGPGGLDDLQIGQVIRLPRP